MNTDKCIVCNEIIPAHKGVYWAPLNGMAHKERCGALLDFAYRDYSNSAHGRWCSSKRAIAEARREFRGPHTWRAIKVPMLTLRGNFRGDGIAAHCDHCHISRWLREPPAGAITEAEFGRLHNIEHPRHDSHEKFCVPMESLTTLSAEQFG